MLVMLSNRGNADSADIMVGNGGNTGNGGNVW